MYTSAFLGCGPRARRHADAYKLVKKGRHVAACDLDADRLSAFGSDYGISSLYADAAEMLEKEKPDLLHIVTAPGLRVPLMTLASDHRVPVVIVEKPIAIQGEDWRELAKLQENTSTKFVVNTQLHFHQANLGLKKLVADGGIGEIRFISVSARSTILDQGVHILELAHSYNGFSRPIEVFAQASGIETIKTHQPSPDTSIASVVFENGVRAQMTTGTFASQSNPAESKYHHKQVAVYGTKGFVRWTMVGWERYTAAGGYQSGDHVYSEEDDKAQARLTDAAFELLGDASLRHGTRLELSLTQFNIILGAYMSTLDRRPISLPCEPRDGLIDSLEAELRSDA